MASEAAKSASRPATPASTPALTRSGTPSSAVVPRPASATAGAVTLRSGTASTAPPRRPPPKVVLDEDDYTDALAAIIERDFFPHLARLRAQEEYLEVQRQPKRVALERHRPLNLSAARRSLSLGRHAGTGEERHGKVARDPRAAGTTHPNARHAV